MSLWLRAKRSLLRAHRATVTQVHSRRFGCWHCSRWEKPTDGEIMKVGAIEWNASKSSKINKRAEQPAGEENTWGCTAGRQPLFFWPVCGHTELMRVCFGLLQPGWLFIYFPTMSWHTVRASRPQGVQVEWFGRKILFRRHIWAERLDRDIFFFTRACSARECWERFIRYKIGLERRRLHLFFFVERKVGLKCVIGGFSPAADGVNAD